MASKQLFTHLRSNFEMFHKYFTNSLIFPGAFKLAAILSCLKKQKKILLFLQMNCYFDITSGWGFLGLFFRVLGGSWSLWAWVCFSLGFFGLGGFFWWFSLVIGWLVFC